MALLRIHEPEHVEVAHELVNARDAGYAFANWLRIGDRRDDERVVREVIERIEVRLGVLMAPSVEVDER